MLGHILYQIFKCCCWLTAIPERDRLKPLNIPEDEEKQKLPTPPPPKIVIAPPKDIVIPSAGVDVDHGTEYVHQSDNEIEDNGDDEVLI